jgi:hypothetical protein
MDTFPQVDKGELIQTGAQLLADKIYSVDKLERFRDQVQQFRSDTSRLIRTDVPVPTTVEKPEDLLDWAAIEKTFVQSACYLLHELDLGDRQ